MDSNINYPLLSWSQRRAAGKPIDVFDYKLIIAQAISLLMWSVPCYYIPENDMGAKSLLPMIFTLFFIYMVHYLAQLLIQRRNGYRYAIYIKFIGPIGAFFLNYWRDGANQDTIYGLFAMVNYDLLFMAQGAIDTIYHKEMSMCYEEYSKTILMPFMFMFFGLNLSLNSPTIYHNEGFLFYYPLYTPTWAQCFHSAGSFFYTYYLTWYMKYISNEIFNKRVYDIVVGGSMYAYLLHYLWIVIMVNNFVKPYDLEFFPAVVVTYIGTEIQILLFHLFTEFLQGKMAKKKAHKREMLKDPD